jgi:hypothetical protein
LPGVGQLEVASAWGQFPTLWSPTGSVKELDVLMRSANCPWAVELKHHQPAGIATYYRHAVGQAALYRAFIRSARRLHPWFRRRGMEAASCEAAVAVTRAEHPDWDLRLKHVQRLARLFRVHVAVIDAGTRSSAQGMAP